MSSSEPTFWFRWQKKRREIAKCTQTYLKLACELSRRLDSAKADFEASAKSCIKQEILLNELKQFKEYLDKQIDLVNRRILDGERIPHSEKIFSLFEPHTEWIQKGKAGKRQELGLKPRLPSTSLALRSVIKPCKNSKTKIWPCAHSKTLIGLRKQHSAVESSINCLEHHGLNRCPDKGLSHFKKYAALGILDCNLHKLGNLLQEKERRKSKNRPLLKAA